jgi:hypothetical protein
VLDREPFHFIRQDGFPTMTPLDAYLAAPGAPTARALLEQVLDGTAPAIYRGVTGYFVHEGESLDSIDLKSLKAPSKYSEEAPLPSAAEAERLFAAAMAEMKAGLARTPFED